MTGQEAGGGRGASTFHLPTLRSFGDLPLLAEPLNPPPQRGRERLVGCLDSPGWAGSGGCPQGLRRWSEA